MAIYGTALLAACLLVGSLIGVLLGKLLGIEKNIGGVGIAMLLLILVCDGLQRSGRMKPPFLLVAGTRATSAQDRALLGDIEKSWLQRSDNASAFTVEWIEKRTIMQGAYGSPDAADNSPAMSWPTESVQHTIDHHLSVARDRMRYVATGPAPDEQTRQFRPRRFLATFDGRVCVSLFGEFNDRTGIRFPLAFSEQTKVNGEANNPHVVPVLITLSALHPWMGVAGVDNAFSFQRATIIETDADLNGHSCVKLRMTTTDGLRQHLYWLDSTRGFIPLRRMASDRGNPCQQHDIEFVSNNVCGWVPSAWTRTVWSLSDNHPVKYRSKCTVTKFELNAPFPPQHFQCELPVGTFVQTDGRQYFRVLEDGSRRPMLAPARRPSDVHSARQEKP